MKSGSSRTKRNAVSRPAEFGEFFFKGLDFRALNECRCLANAVESGENFVAQLRIFRFKIDKRYFHVFRSRGTNKNCTVRQPPPQAPRLCEVEVSVNKFPRHMGHAMV